ncbi:hypothetical protein RRG08_042042 [Elysia crispata]|uniref:G-protein coupled receptors family 1 profile domain-containing protein n=1 Tax=Elysia crispata TaxID=231223 RepID=A0AAE1DBV7_9GAST|nr:hypothetical protein RRG08_042042 [Elysia crispata]
MFFGILANQCSGLLIVSLYSLTTVAMTVQWSTEEPHNMSNALHVSEVSTSRYDLGPMSSTRLYQQEAREVTKAPSGDTRVLEVQFLDTHRGKWFRYSFSYMLVPAVNLLGILSNISNITVFIKAGLKDGASVIFVSLSLSDMLYSCFSIMNRVLRLLEYGLNQHPQLKLSHLAFIVSPYGRLFFDISILITVFAGVQKCACVAIPLTFRHFFTFKKSVVTLVSIFICALVYYLPQLSNYYMAARFDRRFNRTRLMVATGNYRMAVTLSRLSKSVNRISLPIVAEGILIFCVCVMTYKLRQAAVTRKSMTSALAQDEKAADGKDGNDNATGSNLSKKELRVIRSVNIICAVFVVGTAPRCIIEACDLAFKDFGDFSAYESLYSFISSLQDLIIALSIAANIVVYYKFNTKYRETFWEVFSCLLKETGKHKK